MDFDGYKKLYIYGIGKYGQICGTYLSNNDVSFCGYIVSDDQVILEKMLAGKPVIHLSELVCEKDISIIVATSEYYWQEIKNQLILVLGDLKDIDVRYLTDEEVLIMKRSNEPIDSRMFLDSSSPGGSLMGCDRGLSLSRYYIKKYLENECIRIGEVNNTIEVGDDNYSRLFFPKADHFILDYSKGMDLTQMDTLPHEMFDVFICTQVFNFIYDVKKAIEGACYVLKRGGFVVATVAGNISQVSRSDMNNYGDYWRFTDLGIRKLFEETFRKDSVSVMTFGNAMSTTAYIQGMCFEDLPHPELLDVNDPEYALVIGITARKEL